MKKLNSKGLESNHCLKIVSHGRVDLDVPLFED